MCGIAGFIGTGKLDSNNIKNCINLLAQRGPDYSGHVSYQLHDLQVVLIHTRLSIIDLNQHANQPFVKDDLTLIFNGEIYNYLEVRSELEKLGAKFSTNSDTEVFLQAYKTYGEAAFDKLEGMWACAFYRTGEKRILLSRDRFGEKPLYYYQNAQGVFFASEIKALQALSGDNFKINTRHIQRYLVNGYKALYKDDQLFFSDLAAVPPASFGYLNLASNINWIKYWKPNFSIIDCSLESAISGVRDKLFNAVAKCLRADVPIAFCLSGGVDSAGLASIAAKICGYKLTTFSILDTDPRYNEEVNINAVLKDLGCDHFIHTLKHEHDFFEKLYSLIKYHDGPISTISYYVHSFLSSEISKRGFKIAVSGTGADELFTGYYDHFNLHLYTMRQDPSYQQLLFDWKQHISTVVRNPHLQNPELYFHTPKFRDHIYLNSDIFREFLLSEFDEPFSEEYYSADMLKNRMLNELFHESIPVILNEDDLNSMMVSVENRSPYLNRELFEFAISIPNQHLITDGYAKYPLRAALQGILVDSVRLDRTKKGFNASLESLIDLDSPKVIARLLEDSPVFELVNKQKISELLKQRNLTNSYSKFLFNFINVKLFLEQI